MFQGCSVTQFQDIIYNVNIVIWSLDICMTQLRVTDSRKLKYRKVGLPLETHSFPGKFLYIFRKYEKCLDI